MEHVRGLVKGCCLTAECQQKPVKCSWETETCHKVPADGSAVRRLGTVPSHFLPHWVQAPEKILHCMCQLLFPKLFPPNCPAFKWSIIAQGHTGRRLSEGHLRRGVAVPCPGCAAGYQARGLLRTPQGGARWGSSSVFCVFFPSIWTLNHLVKFHLENLSGIWWGRPGLLGDPGRTGSLSVVFSSSSVSFLSPCRSLLQHISRRVRFSSCTSRTLLVSWLFFSKYVTAFVTFSQFYFLSGSCGLYHVWLSWFPSNQEKLD